MRRFLLFVCSVLLCTPVFSQQPNTGASQLEAVRSAFAMIEQSNAYTEDLSSASQNVLPIGIKRVVNNMEVVVAVNKARFYAEYTEISVFAKATLPQSCANQPTVLFFGAEGIKLSHTGSIIGDANLALLEDIEIPFNNGHMSVVLKGGYDGRSGNSRTHTYMSIDCLGFRELGLDAEVCFPTSLIRRADGDSEANQQVRAGFRTVLQNWNDMMVEISLPPFQIVGLNDFVFACEGVVFDFSDSRNNENVRFPMGYDNKYMIPGAPTLWRGLYARDLEVTLPKPFADKQGMSTRFVTHDLLIDENGLTGAFKADKILSFEQGNASGWNFSINSLILELEANRLIGAGFSGELGLPFKGDNTRLGYDAIIRENNEYLMQVSTTEQIDFSLFNAKATILPNSYVTLEVVNDQFRPEAMLHGRMAIVDTEQEIPVSIPALEFRSLLLKTVDPYISVEYFGYSGKVTLGQFPLSLDGIHVRATGREVVLTSGVELTLGEGLFTGSTHLAFAASMREEGSRKYWQFDGVRLDKIMVDANIAGTIKLKGEVGWHRKDPIYGDGFYGDMVLGLEKPFVLALTTRACFGKVDDYRYWFVDGGVELPVGIPAMGPLSIKGFSGAVSHKMIGTGQRVRSEGSAFSSTTYIPNKGTALGLKAAVLLEVQKIARGEACFEIAFSDRGGLNFIGFYGYAEFAGRKAVNLGGLSNLSDKYNAILKREEGLASNGSLLKTMKQLEPNKAAEIVSPIPADMRYGIMGSIGIQYDFTNHALHATTELRINTPGGFLQGVGQGGKAGWGVLHIDPNEWYLHLGSPSNRVGIRLNLGNILNIKTGAYIMAGSQIPAMPPPPMQVANLLGEEVSRLTLMGRDANALSNARGFAFGADFRIATGDLTFLMLYANFQAGLGFDLMLKDFGDTHCKETGREMGMNGWFGQGQSYAYLQGELGVKVNLWFLKAKVPIIKGGAATLLQAQFPNPTLFRGYLGVKVNVLGLVKGNMRFKLSFGEQCTPVIAGSSPLEMAMIGDLSPADNTSEVNVFTSPQVTFNTQIGRILNVEDDSGPKTYRILLKSFLLTDEQGVQIQGELKWNGNKDIATFQAKEILPPKTRLKAKVQVSFDELVNGIWRRTYVGAKEALEERECTFTTGEAPDYIPLQNVQYCYPVLDQQYFLPGESSQGYVQLQFGQKYLFNRGFDYQLVFSSSGHPDIAANFDYNEGRNRLEFTMPELRRGARYLLQFLYTPREVNGEDAQNQIQTRQLYDTDDGGLSMETRLASAGTNTALRKSILDYSFGTSLYSTFSEKINAMEVKLSLSQDLGLSERFLYAVEAREAYDLAEIKGTDKSEGKPLIRAQAELKEPFFIEDVNPLLYNDYPFGSIRLQYRVDSAIGAPPVRSVFPLATYIDQITNHNPRPTYFRFPFTYETGVIIEQDLRDLQHQVVNNPSMVSPQVYNRFVSGRLKFIRQGMYKSIFQYVLPGGEVSSSCEFYFNNFLKYNPE